MSRLCLENLASLPGSVSIPNYLKEHLKEHLKESNNPQLNHELPGIGIVHLGMGQFARGHLAYYTDSVLQQAPGDWRIVGASLRSDMARQQLEPQDNLYTVTSQSSTETHIQVIGALAEVISVQFSGRTALLNHLISPSSRIVSLTITEKGYYQNAHGQLDLAHADIQTDLAHLEAPETAIGWIVLALKIRRDNGFPPFTALSLDNLVGNGAVLKRMVLEYAQHSYPELVAYIKQRVSFPSTMVDRIVPAQSTASMAATAKQIGVEDHGCVHTEKFSQWVIEDDFVGGRPAWELAGVIFCDDVAPYEGMKLRLLNGAHSSIAYIGVLLGHGTVADCMNDLNVRAYIETLMRSEIQPTVSPPVGFDLDLYIEQLLDRFSNPNLHHRCEQIAMDGSQKIPQRLLPVLAARLKAGAAINHLVFSIAAWMVFVQQHEPLLDPRSSELKRLVLDAEPEQLAEALLGTDLFPATLQKSTDFSAALVATINAIIKRGPAAALSACCSNTLL